MTKESGKLPVSSPAKAVALFLLADLSLVGLVIAILVEDSTWIAVFAILAVVLFGGFLFVSLRLSSTDGRYETLFSLGRMGWSLAATLFWSVAVGLSIFALGYGVAIAAPETGPILIYGLVFLAIMFVAWSGARAAIHRRRMLLIISHLEKAVSMGLPMPRMIEAAAQGEQGVMRQRLLALHDHLDRGESLDLALLYAVPEVPVSVTRAIAAGLHMGCLGHVLERILRQRRRGDPNASPNAGFYWAYPVILIAIVALISIFVMPKFQSIFHDFHMDLPPFTRLMLALAGNSSVIIVGVLVLALIPLGRALGGLFPFFRVTPPFGGAITDQLIWWTPFLGGAVRDRGMADLCDFVAAGVQAGHPLNDSLREAAGAQANSVMRYRATAWADAVSRGESMHEAARYARMPELFAAMLATVRNDESLLQVMGFLWRNYEFRFSRARAIAQAAYVPLIVLVFGSLVAMVGCSLIQPIAMLADNLASKITGGF